MARTRQRQGKRLQDRRKRTCRHILDRAIQVEAARLHPIIVSILQDCPPAFHHGAMAVEAIERRFDTDPLAPLILYSGPCPSLVAGRNQPLIQVSVNHRAVERELRARGIYERHPAWEFALDLAGSVILEVATECIREAAAEASRANGEWLERLQG
jgi:hypothetical protein